MHWWTPGSTTTKSTAHDLEAPCQGTFTAPSSPGTLYIEVHTQANGVDSYSERTTPTVR